MNNIFVGHSDPLLGNNPLNNNYQQEYDQQISQMEAAKQRYIQAQQAQIPQQTKTPIWDDINKEIESLSSTEIAAINNNEEYQRSNKGIEIFLQSELIKFMRPIIEGTKDGKEILQEHLSLVRRLKKGVVEQTSKELELFNEYKTKYSDITFDEFLKLKKEKEKKK